MPTFTAISPSFLTLSSLFLVLFCLLSPAVRSEHELSVAIRLPSDESSDGSNGVCGGVADPSSCPINCFRADPVCGVDGVTYWCGCPDALCHGTRVAKLGPCEVGNGGPGQALLLVHIVWLFLLAFAVLFGVF